MKVMETPMLVLLMFLVFPDIILPATRFCNHLARFQLVAMKILQTVYSRSEMRLIRV